MANSNDYNKILLKYLGLISHDEAMASMQQAHEKCSQNQGPNTLFVLEHYPVITRGRRLHDQDVALSPELVKRDVQIRDVDRGGLLTFHGSGQIVVYFVLRVSDFFSGVKDLVKRTEEVMLEFLSKCGVQARTHPEYPGIWVKEKKMASIGFRVTQDVTTHGICMNLCNDLSVYKYFEPCGLPGNVMTNLEEVLNRKIEREEFERLSLELGEAFVDSTQKFGFDSSLLGA